MENEQIIFQFERLDSMEDVRKQIQECEGKHSQQIAYSSFHDCLTQVCFVCRKIRSTKGA